MHFSDLITEHTALSGCLAIKASNGFATESDVFKSSPLTFLADISSEIRQQIF